MKKVIIGFFFLLSVCFSVYGNQVSVSAKIDSSSILIGEQASIRLEVVQDAKSKVQFPMLADSLVSGLEVVSVSKIDTADLEAGMKRMTQDIVVTSFDSALFYIPPFQFFVNGKDSMETSPLSLKVSTLQVDTTKQDLYDIKPIYSAPINWKEIAFYVLIGLLIIAIICVIVWYVRKRKNKAIEEAEILPVVENPYEHAMQELNRIKDEKIWQQGRVKEFYTDVTTVLRFYLKYRFHIEAMEMTSDEILDAMEDVANFENGEAKENLKQILRLADLVKFAKWTPSFNEHDMMLSNAFNFVNITKEIIEQTEENSPASEQSSKE